MTPTSITRRTALAGAGAALLTGCGLGTSGGFTPSGRLAGALATLPRLEGAEIAVGSRNFTEQILLGKMSVSLLTSAGAKVTDLTNIPGSASARQAFVQGQVTSIWEYTGTAWVSYLGHPKPIQNEQAQYRAVRDEEARRGLVWLPPAPMNNTYGFALPRARQRELGITKLSELPKVPREKLSFCIESELANRDDGFYPMLQRYGLARSAVPANQVRLLDAGAIYEATTEQLCTFGEVFTTDGRIKALDLVVLADDRQFFPKYNVCQVLHRSLYDSHPQLARLFAPVTQALTDQAVIELNSQVDLDGREPAEVAAEWLHERGFIEL